MNTDRSVVKRKSRILPVLITSISILVVLSVLSFFAVKHFKKITESKNTISRMSQKWSEYDYAAVYDIGKQILQVNPFNNAALTYNGYACFYLAVSQIDTSSSQNYLDESINCLRLALYSAKKSLKPQLEYMLGKAYFYKNTVSSYYFSDLSLKYLKEAQEHGYKADDIPEYMGLCYAALNMPLESISAFTEALQVRESDSLLLSIAEQYYKLGQTSACQQYLFRVKKDSQDEELVLKSMNLLGTIYIDEKKYDEARQEFESILEKNKNAGDAYYGLGVIYEKQGDIVKARAEWRKALKVQVNHAGALAKISNYK